MKLTTVFLTSICAFGASFSAHSALIETDLNGVFDTLEIGSGPYQTGDDMFSGFFQFNSNASVSEYSYKDEKYNFMHYSGSYDNAFTEFSFILGGDRYHLSDSGSNNITISGYVQYAEEDGTELHSEYYDMSFSAWLETDSGDKVKIGYQAYDGIRDTITGPLFSLPVDGDGPNSGNYMYLEGYNEFGEMTYRYGSTYNSDYFVFREAPEPATYAMLLLGGIGLVARRLKRA
ncbi:PEP-CTERM sorting domain-containing protein [Hahella aquimaris]|uniref:PEP-CTERM sorting domain-containing protein n=1 Tax=Hahella sp. HNIBRBA332 TaxID=3015983 RepID=UPI00273BFAD3|nr:PEP-CTERM sorting domain-containing protein [Hahella sp. HNIBRBA332]WLQ12012.1 PEP-CTERM sorting domain-containing protein [Hahella sp. HNIBRBA332]